MNNPPRTKIDMMDVDIVKLLSQISTKNSDRRANVIITLRRIRFLPEV